MVPRYLVGLFALLPALAFAQVRGYQPRACGFDMNFDGVRSGSAADCTICDHQSGTSTLDEDVDGNGVNDRQVYVDGTSGSNNTTCGTPNAPCATVAYAMDGSNTAVTGGPIGTASSRQIQAICVRGTFNSVQVIPSQSGDNTTNAGDGATNGVYTIAQSGSQVRSFEYPRYPFIFSGWDDDNDNCYPPEDDGVSAPSGCGAAQTNLATFDGNASGNTDNFWCNGNNVSRIELAHVIMDDYNQGATTIENGGGLLDPHGYDATCAGNGTGDHFFAHDFDAATVSNGEGGVVIAYGGDGATYEAYENFQVTDFRGFIVWRGSCSFTNDCGPIRWQNFTITKTASTGSWSKAWGFWTGVEVIDSVYDCTINDNFGLRAIACNQDWVFRNNEIIDCHNGNINVEPWPGQTGFCNDTRAIDSIVMDRNLLTNNLGSGGNAVAAIFVSRGDEGGDWLEDLTITNNIISEGASGDWDAGILLAIGHDSGSGDIPGTWTIIGNTISVDAGGTGFNPALIQLGQSGASTGRRQQDIVIRNNIFDNLGATTDNLIQCNDNPTGLLVEDNIYPSGASDGVWNCFGSTSSLATWRSNLGGCPGTDNDCSATRCDPTFVGGGDYHLQASDTCAQDSASDPDANFTLCTTCVDQDIDADSRPQGSWDAGADEVTQATQTLTVTNTGVGTAVGTVTSAPAGINCGGDCTEDYATDTVVTLTATPNVASDFDGWSGDADCADGVVTMSAPVACTATFERRRCCIR